MECLCSLGQIYRQIKALSGISILILIKTAHLKLHVQLRNSRQICTPGPWTPSIRMPSMSAVLLGPVTNMIEGSSPKFSMAEATLG
jgi:hypothetical protein